MLAVLAVLAVLARGVTDGRDTVADELDVDTQCQLRGLIEIVCPSRHRASPARSKGGSLRPGRGGECLVGCSGGGGTRRHRFPTSRRVAVNDEPGAVEAGRKEEP